jgi:NitT/TauT family transport system substrate-binding protein
MSNPENVKNLEAIKRMLSVSPGSTMLLRGHVDNAQVSAFREQGGEAYVKKQALRAIELSRNRADAIRTLLIDKFGVDPKRLDIVGRGWEEPAGPESAQNRRVEVQWFTIE